MDLMHNIVICIRAHFYHKCRSNSFMNSIIYLIYFKFFKHTRIVRLSQYRFYQRRGTVDMAEIVRVRYLVRTP